ncbi:MAG: hypothetical protein QJR01_05940 [Kyrpidia sp.]|nr:hypothetical protein [Kyrpidia sp.]
MDRRWDEFFRRIQEENDLLLEEIQRLLEERDAEIRALRVKVAELEERLAKCEQQPLDVSSAGGMALGSESPRETPASLERLARQTGRGVGEIQLILALAERRKKGRGPANGGGPAPDCGD